MKRGLAVLLAVFSVFALTTTGLAGGLEGYVTASVLYVRDLPYSESNTIHQVKLGEKVTILSKENEWYYVVCANGTIGYVYEQFIGLSGTDSSSGLNGSSSASTTAPTSAKTSTASTAAQTGNSSKTTAVSTASVPSLTRIGDRGNFVTTIQEALTAQGYFTSSIDGIFGQLTLQAVRKFQKENGLVVDGIVGKATLNAMFGDTVSYSQGTNTETQSNVKSASSVQQPQTQVWDETTKTETAQSPTTTVASSSSKAKSLDWYNEGYSLISKNKNITIYDLKTGVVWSAKYINGKNHADIIPASAADVKKITGSDIVGSYVRRPVVVTIAGTDYAGSMYAVGHGETSYCDHFKGVMCIHFTGSQTHGTQKVDADHQKAIETALKATVDR